MTKADAITVATLALATFAVISTALAEPLPETPVQTIEISCRE